MPNENIITKVEHSTSRHEWKVVNTKLGAHYKLAKVPYVFTLDKELNEYNKEEARQRAEFISLCFNNRASIMNEFDKL